MAFEVVIVSIKPTQCVYTLQTGLALGANTCIHIEFTTFLFAFFVSKIFMHPYRVHDFPIRFLCFQNLQKARGEMPRKICNEGCYDGLTRVFERDEKPVTGVSHIVCDFWR
ncbi:hypothetical protein V8G54_017172 [Vigna mungo]|uniref:Uncharacterized protein n=1 Tax=Vigna mungo TaxID=3915 RepID=A0AAQ3NP08_VIGMU